jgi:hypothetical protein
MREWAEFMIHSHVSSRLFTNFASRASPARMINPWLVEKKTEVGGDQQVVDDGEAVGWDRVAEGNHRSV